MKKVLLSVFLLLSLTACGQDSELAKKTDDSSQWVPQYTTGQYYEMLSGAFSKSIQNNIAAPKKWIFEINTKITGQWDLKKLQEDLGLQDVFAYEDFKWMSLNLNWNYNFEKKDSAFLDIRIRFYLSNQALWIWDFDARLVFSWSAFKYKVNNLEPKVLDFLGFDEETKDMMLAAFLANKEKWERIEMLDGVLESLWSELKVIDSPLEDVSTQEDEFIVNSFIQNHVLDILTGSSLQDEHNMQYKIEPKNLTKFMNDVAGFLLGAGPESEIYSESELKNLSWQGTLKLQKDLIKEFLTIIELPLTYLDEKNEEKTELLVIDSNLTINSYEYPYWQFEITAKNATAWEFWLQLIITWLIK